MSFELSAKQALGVAAFSLLFLAAFFLYLDTARPKYFPNDRRIFTFQRLPLNFGITYDQTNGAVVSGVLLTDKVQSDANGKYLDVSVPDVRGREQYRVRTHFEIPQGTSVLELEEGEFQTQQVWKGMLFEQLEGRLEKGSQVVIYVDVNEETFARYQERVDTKNNLTVGPATHVTVRI